MKLFLSVNEFKEALDKDRPSGIGRSAVRKAVATGSIRSIKIGNKSLIPASELTAWTERELEATK